MVLLGDTEWNRMASSEVIEQRLTGTIS